MRTDFSRRPPRILLHPDSCGSGTWRLAEPAMELRRRGWAISVLKGDRFLTDDELKKLNPDIIVVQRTFGARQVSEVERYRRCLPETFLIMDLDDLLWGVPKHNPAHSTLDNTATLINRARRLERVCDRVVLSTKALESHWKETIGGTHADIAVLGPYLPDWFFSDVTYGSRKARIEPSDCIRIGFAGSVTHTSTLNRLRTLIKNTTPKLQWVFLGCKPEGVDDLIEFHDLCEIDKYPEALGALGLHIAIAPYATTAFDYCKTDLRLGELGALGIPVLTDHDDRGPESALNRAIRSPEKFLEYITEAATAFDAETAVGANHARYSLTHNIEKVLKSWLPENAKPFIGLKGVDKPLVVTPEGCKVFGSPETDLPGNWGSVSYLTNAGIYPHGGEFTILPEAAGSVLPVPIGTGLASLLHPAAAGSVTLSSQALARVGEPDWDRFTNPEEALVDWAEWAAEHGFGHCLSGSQFVWWDKPTAGDSIDLAKIDGWYPKMRERYESQGEGFQESQMALCELVETTFMAGRMDEVAPGTARVAYINYNLEQARAVTEGGAPCFFIACSEGVTHIQHPPMPNVPDYVLGAEEGVEAFRNFVASMQVSSIVVGSIRGMTVDDVQAMAHLPGITFPDDALAVVEALKALP